jgi:hypothetical protein
MNLNEYELLSLFYIPSSLIFWAIDFLSDKNITENELKIGILQYVHHFIATILIFVIIIFLTSKSLIFTIVSILITLGVQVGFLINDDYCFYTRMVNKELNPNIPDRKWRNDIESYIKHYIRGDDWAYSDIWNQDKTPAVIYGNVLLILQLIKLIIT